jgi:uncharacterized alpha/beta hydrolase family protein
MMKKLILAVVFSSLVFGANTTIKALLTDIAKKAEAKQYKAIEKDIYSLSEGFNVDWIVGGITNPNKEDSIVSSFSVSAVKKLAKNSGRFVAVKQSKYKSALQKSFTRKFTDDSRDKRFFKDLKRAKNIYVLVKPRVGSVVVYKDGAVYKLVWWKDMVRLANALK